MHRLRRKPAHPDQDEGVRFDVRGGCCALALAFSAAFRSASSLSAASLAMRSALNRAVFAALAARAFSISCFTSLSRCSDCVKWVCATLRAESVGLGGPDIWFSMKPCGTARGIYAKWRTRQDSNL